MGNDKRAATFLTCIGPDGIEIYDSLPLPAEKKNDMSEILNKFQTYCVGETNEIVFPLATITMAPRHALFLQRHALFPSAMPFF